MSKIYEARTLLEANDKKLMPHYREIMERKGPIHIQIMPTNLCNLKCEFCGIKDTNDGSEVLPLNKILDTIDALKPHLKSVEITGGGEPTLYPHLEDLINALYDRKLKIGMVCNGVNLKHIKNVLFKLNWLRISVNGFIDKGMAVDFDIIPSDLKLGISYIFHPSNISDCGTKLHDLMWKYRKIRYCRISNDVYGKDDTRTFVDHGNGIYEIRKPWGKSTELCYQGSIRPILAPNGFLFPCCVYSIVEGKYDPKHALTIDMIKNFKPHHCTLSECIFGERNTLIQIALDHHDVDIDFV